MLSIEFQVKTLGRVMEEPLYQLGEFPLPSHFSDPVCAELCQIIRDTSHQLKEPITYSILKNAICAWRQKDPETARRMARIWRQMQRPISKVEKKYLESEIAASCRKAAVQEALLKAVDYWREDRLDEIEDLVQKALQVGRGNGSLGTFFFSEAPGLLTKEQEVFKPIRTLISALDSRLAHGGLCSGDLGVVLAMPGYGKTNFLLHCAKAALIQRKKIAYISLEMNEADLSERLIASFSGIPIDEIFDRRANASKRVKAFGRMLGDNLLIKHFPSQTASINTIAGHLKLVYAQTGFRPDLVMVDYAGEVLPKRGATKQGSGERYLELGNVFSELVGYAQEEKISLWTGAQANREKGRELITIESIAESFKSIFVASVIISLNQTLEEHQNQQMRLFLAKNRKNICREIILISTNFRVGAFYRKLETAEDE